MRSLRDEAVGAVGVATSDAAALRACDAVPRHLSPVVKAHDGDGLGWRSLAGRSANMARGAACMLDSPVGGPSVGTRRAGARVGGPAATQPGNLGTRTEEPSS